MKLLYVLLSFSFLLSCQSEDRRNARAYVEGNITAKSADYGKISLSLNSAGKSIAEVKPSANTTFILSGPLLNDTFTLAANKKIKSFSTSKSGCSLSADSTQILVPAGTTYLIFNEINFK